MLTVDEPTLTVGELPGERYRRSPAVSKFVTSRQILRNVSNELASPTLQCICVPTTADETVWEIAAAVRLHLTILLRKHAPREA